MKLDLIVVDAGAGKLALAAIMARKQDVLL